MNLEFLRSIVRDNDTELKLHKHENGQLVLSALLESPVGTAFFTTSDGLLDMFYKGMISIQQLFDNSPSNNISIFVNNNTRIFLCGEVDVQVRNGRKHIHDF